MIFREIVITSRGGRLGNRASFHYEVSLLASLNERNGRYEIVVKYHGGFHYTKIFILRILIGSFNRCETRSIIFFFKSLFLL